MLSVDKIRAGARRAAFELVQPLSGADLRLNRARLAMAVEVDVERALRVVVRPARRITFHNVVRNASHLFVRLAGAMEDLTAAEVIEGVSKDCRTRVSRAFAWTLDGSTEHTATLVADAAEQAVLACDAGAEP